MRDGVLGHIASLVCHQMDDRSFAVGNHFLPLCGRCTGIYAGFAIGAFFLAATGSMRAHRLPSVKLVLVSAFVFAVMVVEAAGEKLLWWGGSNECRLHTGLLGGGAISILLLPLCGYFLSRKPFERGTDALRDYGVFVILAGSALAIHLCSSLLAVLPALSMTGLVGLYLCLNLAVSGAVLDLRHRNQSCLKLWLLVGLVLGLFLGEEQFLSLIRTRQ